MATSLGIAILSTLVQGQSKVHYVHLAEQVTPNTSMGLLVIRLQAYLSAHGFDSISAHMASIARVVALVQRQAYMLAIQDAFWLSLPVVIAAVIAAICIRGRRLQSLEIPPRGEDDLSAEEEDAIRREAMVAG